MNFKVMKFRLGETIPEGSKLIERTREAANNYHGTGILEEVFYYEVPVDSEEAQKLMNPPITLARGMKGHD